MYSHSQLAGRGLSSLRRRVRAQIAMAREKGERDAYAGAIVVISEEEKAWMDAEIVEALKDGPRLEARPPTHR